MLLVEATKKETRIRLEVSPSPAVARPIRHRETKRLFLVLAGQAATDGDKILCHWGPLGVSITIGVSPVVRRADGIASMDAELAYLAGRTTF